ncbi:MAG: alpha/beta hydrolase, partial [Pseudoclavibacter sp.]
MSQLPRERSSLAIQYFGDWSGAGNLVVCSPGMGDHRDAFTPLAERLAAAGCRAATVDLRGHGDSGADFDAFGDEATASDLIAVIEHLSSERADSATTETPDTPTPAIIIGASMSAAAAVIAASQRPDLVAGLVLAGPFLRGGSPAMAAVMRLMLLKPWGPAVWRGYAAKLWPGLDRDEARARAARLTSEQQGPGRWRAFRRTAATDHAVVAPHLAKVRCSSAVVMGTADPDWPNPVAEA